MLKQLKDSTFAKSVLNLMSGTIVAQLIPILLTPILSRLYSPEDFGIYSLFTSICSILLVIATGSLELAIMLPKEDKEAIQIMNLSGLLSVSVSLVFGLCLLFIGDYIVKLLTIEVLGPIVYIIPIYLIISSLTTLLRYYNNRKQRFSNIRNVTIMESAVRGGVNVGIGISFPTHTGLVWGQFVASLTCIYWWIKHDFKLIKQVLFSTTISNYQILIRRYIKNLSLGMPGGLLNIMSTNLPVFLLNYYYTSNIVGQYTMSQRLVALPITFIMAAFVNAFRQKASDIYNTTGNIRPFLIKYTKYLFFISIIPFTVLLLLSPFIFVLILGEEWSEAGTISGILVIRFFSCFVLSGISNIIIQITEKYEFDVVWQFSLLLLTALIFYIGHMFWSFHQTLVAYVLLYVFMYLILYIYSYRISCKIQTFE